MISKRLSQVANSIAALSFFTFSSLFAQNLTVSSQNLTSSNLSTVNIDDFAGSSTISISAPYKITNTNNSGKTINYVGSAVSNLTINVANSARLEGANSTSSRAIYVDNANASLVLNVAGRVSAYGSSDSYSSPSNNTAIEIVNAKSSEIYLTAGSSAYFSGDIINRGDGLLKIDAASPATINSDIFLGSNAASSVTLKGARIEGSINFENSGQSLNLDSGSIYGTVNNQGSIVISPNTTFDSYVQLLTSTLSATINSETSTSTGFVMVMNGHTLTLNADIGATNPIKKFLFQESVVDLSANNNIINASEGIELVNNSTLKLGNRTSNSEIKLNGGYNGSNVLVEVKGDNTLGGTVNIGSGKIAIDANKTLSTAANNVTASSISLNEGSKLSIGSGVISSSIEANQNGVGTLSISAANYTLNSSVGSSTKKLKNVEILTNATLNLGARILNSNDVTLSQGAVLNVGQGGVSNNIIGVANGVGVVNFVNSATINGSLGSDLKALAQINIASGKSINLAANSSNLKNLDLADSSSVGSSGANTLNLTNAAGNYIVTIADEAALTNSNANGNVINFSGTQDASLNVTLNDDGNNNQTKIQANDSSQNALLFDNDNADLVINNNSASIIGGITINAAKSSILINSSGNFSNSGKIEGDITNNSAAKLEANLSGNAYINGAVSLGSNANSKIELNQNSSITGQITLGNSAQKIAINDSAIVYGSVVGAGNILLKDDLSRLWLKSSTLSANIDSASDAISGEVAIMNDQSVVVNADIGSTKAVKTLVLQSGSTLDLAQHDKAVTANNIFLSNASTIKLGDASVNSDISLAGSDNGSAVKVEVLGDNKLNGNIAIGLGSLNIGQGATLSLEDNQINAAAIVMDEDSTLNMQQGTVSSDIAASGYGFGAVNFTVDGQFTKNIGTTLNPLASVSVALGKTVQLGDLTTINALNISIADKASLNGRTDQLVGDISFEGSSRLSLNGGNISGEINGSQNGDFGTLYINEGQEVTATKDLGAKYKLNSVELGARATLNLDANGGNSLASKTLILNSDSTLNVGSKALNSPISASSAGVGTVNFKENNSLAGNVGSADNKLLQLNIAADKTLNNGDFEINANQISLNSRSVLNVGLGAVKGAITGAGAVNLDGANISGLTIGADNQNISAVNVNAAKSVNLSNSTIYANQVAVLENSSLTLGEAANIRGDFSLSQNANLTINDGANFASAVKSSSNSSANGSLNINAREHVIDYAIGDNNNFLHQVNIGQNSSATIFSQINSRSTNIFGTANFSSSQGNMINGDLNVANGAVLNLFDQNHSVAGNLNVASGATIKLEINKDSAGSITAAGLASINSGTLIRLTIDPVLLKEQVKSGLSYTVITGAEGSDIGAISASNIALLNNSTALNLKFSTIISNNSLILNVVQEEEKSQDRGQDALGNTDGQKNLYLKLLNLGNVNGNLLVLKQLLLNGQDRASALGALEAASLQIDNSINKLSFENTSDSLAITSKRINALRGISSGSGMSQKSVWIQTFGAKIHQGNTAISNGYSANTQGLLVGFDREVEDDLILGSSLSYVDSSIESIGKQKLTNLDSYQLNIYGAKDFSQYFVNAMLGFAYNEYSSLRKISILNMEAKAKYSGQTYVSRVEAGGNFRMENNYIVTPLLAITMAKNVVQNYQETGAPDLNYRVRNNSTSFFETRLGVNVSKLLQPGKMQKIQPNFGISYGYDFAGSKQKTRATFVGQDASFDAKSANIPQGSLRFEVGTKIFYMNAFSFDAVYAFDLRNNYHAHSGSVRAKYDF